MRENIKRFFAAFVAIVTIICVFPTATRADSALAGYTVLYGDTNIDGRVSIADLSLLMRYCNGLTNLQATQIINSDVNCDKRINTADVSLILRFITGMVNTLPVVSEQNRKVVFNNYTLPKAGVRIPLNKSYSLNADISSEVPITSVCMKITDIESGKVEINESILFTVGVYSYAIKNSTNSLDKLIKFSSLSPGEKLLELSCSTKLDSNVMIYTSRFTMGFSFTELYGNIFDKGDKVSAETTNKILNLLNSYDTGTNTGEKIVGYGINSLGKQYSELDCSGFVRTTYSNAIGLSLPRISADQAKFCAENDMLIDYSELQPGDLVFMRRTDCGCDRYHDIHHVAIYLGEVDGVKYLIESTSSIYGVVIREMWGLSGGKWQIDCCARPYN